MDQMQIFEQAEGTLRSESDRTLTNAAIQRIRDEAREAAQREIDEVLNGSKPALSLTERQCLRAAS